MLLYFNWFEVQFFFPVLIKWHSSKLFWLSCLQLKRHISDSLWSLSIPTTSTYWHISVHLSATWHLAHPFHCILAHLSTYLCKFWAFRLWLWLSCVWNNLCHGSCVFACSRGWYLFFLPPAPAKHHPDEPILRASFSCHQMKCPCSAHTAAFLSSLFYYSLWRQSTLQQTPSENLLSTRL